MKGKIRWNRVAALGVVLCLTGVLVAPFVWVKSDALAPGVSIQGEQVGGKTQEEMRALLAEKNQALQAEKLLLAHGSAAETWSFQELQVHYDDSSLDSAMALGRTGNWIEQWYERWHMRISGASSALVAVYSEETLAQKVKTLEATYRQPPQNAEPRFQADGSISFTQGRPYLKIDTAALHDQVAKQLQRGEPGTLDIPVIEEKEPNLTAEEAKAINRVLGRYTTYFYPEKNRSKNIELAAHSLNGIYLKPGELFSYNQATGSRSADNGYLEAPVILNGKLVPGSGGGVCQVSTTLFNAVLLAGLEVTERTCHYSPVSYAPIGRDATVAEGSLDFCFRNHLKQGIYLYTEYAPGSVTVWILGNQNDVPSSVDITKTKEEILPFKTVTCVNPSQKEDKKEEPGHEGHLVTVTQNVTWADGRTYHDSFYSDYEAVDTVITYKKKPATDGQES